MIEQKQEREANGYFRGSHRQDENEDHLSVGLAPARGGDDERQSRGVQHDLERHKNEEQITAHQQPDHSQREQGPRQNQAMRHGYGRHQCDSPL